VCRAVAFIIQGLYSRVANERNHLICWLNT
jgi:hypothetical protein